VAHCAQVIPSVIPPRWRNVLTSQPANVDVSRAPSALSPGYFYAGIGSISGVETGRDEEIIESSTTHPPSSRSPGQRATAASCLLRRKTRKEDPQPKRSKLGCSIATSSCDLTPRNWEKCLLRVWSARLFHLFHY
jgi:hypothetical protein